MLMVRSLMLSFPGLGSRSFEDVFRWVDIIDGGFTDNSYSLVGLETS